MRCVCGAGTPYPAQPLHLARRPMVPGRLLHRNNAARRIGQGDPTSAHISTMRFVRRCSCRRSRRSLSVAGAACARVSECPQPQQPGYYPLCYAESRRLSSPGVAHLCVQQARLIATSPTAADRAAHRHPVSPARALGVPLSPAHAHCPRLATRAAGRPIASAPARPISRNLLGIDAI